LVVVFMAFDLLLLNTLFDFPIFQYRAYPMKAIPETRRRTKFDIYVFIKQYNPFLSCTSH